MIFEDFPCKFKTEGRRIKPSNICPQSGIEFTLAISRVISYLPVNMSRQEELLYRGYIKLKSGGVTWDTYDDGQYKEEQTILINQYVTRNGGFYNL